MSASLHTRNLVAVLVVWLALAAQPGPPGIAAVPRRMLAPVELATSLLYLPRIGRADPWLDRVAERTMAMHGAVDLFDWEGGVAMAGMMAAYEATSDPTYLDHIAEWVDSRLAEGVTFAGSSRVAPPCASGQWPGEGLWHPNHATPTWAVAGLYHYRPRPEYREIVAGAVLFLRYDACRVDGTLAHVPNQLWDDTLIVSVPVLARYGSELDQPELLDLAADEVLAHARRLQDPKTGLWYHGWDAVARNHMAGAFWARGNGWAALAMTELLRWLPVDHPKRAEIIAVLERQLIGLIDRQDPQTGLWHTVVDRPDFYLETSGSAAIAAAILRATEAGWIDAGWASYGRRARAAVQSRVAPDGTLTGVSAGTGVASSIETYNTISTDQIRPYGQGLYMIMATAAGGR